jgi:asparagine synthetase B (glutamine-hydrolysing)
MPPALKLGAGIEKVVLKRAYADALPREVIERPKRGTPTPGSVPSGASRGANCVQRILDPERIQR